MALRMIEIVLPPGYKNVAVELISSQKPLDFWEEEISDEQTRIKILLLSEKTESMMDALEKRFYKIDGFRMMLMVVEASVPRPRPEEDIPLPEKHDPADKKKKDKSSRVAREELYSDVNQMSKLSWVFVFLIVLASIVAAIGILLPIPNALEVTFRPGAACLRLYSFRCTALATHRTVSRSKPISTMRSTEYLSSM